MSQQLPLPIAPVTAIQRLIRPTLSLLPARMASDAAIVLLLVIMLQKSKLAHRWQVVDLKHPERKGPACGLAQFELGGGVKAVCTHAASQTLAAALCALRGVAFDQRAIWEALDDDDVLAVGLARLLLFTDPQPLPAIGALNAMALLRTPDTEQKRVAFILLAIQESTQVCIHLRNGKKVHRVTVTDLPLYNWGIEKLSD